MKRCSLVALLLLAPLFVGAQIVTDNPYVEKGYKNAQFGETRISRIAIDNDYTIVFLEETVSRNCNSCGVSLSKETTLSAHNGKNAVKIIEWGLLEDREYTALELDRQYSVSPGRRYMLCMVFPKISAGVELIDIVERSSAGEGWAWYGVHINNPASSGGMAKGSGRSSKEVNSMDYDDNRSSSQSKSSKSKEEGSQVENTPAGKSSSWSDYDRFEVTAMGTGFALSSNGYIATCHHVVENARRVRIRGVGGDFSKTYRARVVLTDRENDLAVVKIEDTAFRTFGTLPYEVENTVADVGEDVFALGYPLQSYMGDEIKLTNGIVSSSTGFQGDVTSYQLSVAVYPGNSGGPLFNSRGNVVGVVNARLLENATYAVKTTYLHSLVRSLSALRMTGSNRISALSLSEKVKKLRNFVYIVEIE